jgi:hypothetical protein
MAAQPSAASRRAGTCISAPGAERLAANKTGPEGESGDLRLEFIRRVADANSPHDFDLIFTTLVQQQTDAFLIAAPSHGVRGHRPATSAVAFLACHARRGRSLQRLGKAQPAPKETA